MFLPMFIVAAIAGILIGYVAIPELQALFNFKHKSMILVMIFVMMMLSIFIATSIHNDERARANTDDTRTTSLYWCFIESPDQCQNNVNTLNNQGYADYTSGKTTRQQMYLPISMINSIMNNFATAFCIGLMLSFIVVNRKDFYGQ